MSIDLLKLCDPGTYYDKFISEEVYPDGRPINTFTALSFQRGACGGVGSALVRQGGVTVSCAVTASIVLCHDGDLVIPVINACESVNKQAVNDIMDVLGVLFSRNLMFSRKALLCQGCEESVAMSWQLTLNISILNGDGCVSDAVVGAVVAALSDVRLPLVKLAHAKDDEAPVDKSEISLLNQTCPIELLDFPVASTFVLYESSSCKEKISHILCDPPTEIMNMCHAQSSIIMGKTGVLYIRTAGLICQPNQIASMVDWAKKRRQSVVDAMK